MAQSTYANLHFGLLVGVGASLLPVTTVPASRATLFFSFLSWCCNIPTGYYYCVLSFVFSFSNCRVWAMIQVGCPLIIIGLQDNTFYWKSMCPARLEITLNCIHNWMLLPSERRPNAGILSWNAQRCSLPNSEKRLLFDQRYPGC